ncbi:saccharopine dehydrogenase family protein [Paenibacillus lautus]|uniref:saccharopine dehydrogenase family protein n=1 Tax=Paenibacillus lautus TaxID=1401 RepID=UPI001C7D54D2|nr:saccharopine dehydrogenase NADP-binding domain-containing protein [Paenibacillus lautus]MBX4149394.1 saccharopine dehydrogenase NADP-binding domain-containing protein [Paenibacillus lautus]
MKERIVVVGGYGHVGRIICEELGEKYPGLVYAAGRSLERAERFSQETSGKVLPMRLDMGQPVMASEWERIKLVVMCLDQADDAWVGACIRSGTHYVDISAKAEFLNQVSKWKDAAEESGSSAILSVGLAPGLTNLMASWASKGLDVTESVDISIMLGLGDRHGKAAVEWTVDNLLSTFQVMENHRVKTVASFSDGRSVFFGEKIGRKSVYRFPFSDQSTLPNTLEVPTVSTRLGFDSSPLTTMLAGFRASGLHHLLKVKWIRNAAVKAFMNIRMGSDDVALKVEAQGKRRGKNSTVESLLVGRDQSRLTAKVAASVADALYSGNIACGVFHIEQVFELASMKGWLEKEVRMEVWRDGKRGSM